MKSPKLWTTYWHHDTLISWWNPKRKLHNGGSNSNLFYPKCEKKLLLLLGMIHMNTNFTPGCPTIKRGIEVHHHHHHYYYRRTLSQYSYSISGFSCLLQIMTKVNTFQGTWAIPAWDAQLRWPLGFLYFYL